MWLLMQWIPSLRMRISYRPTPLSNASVVLVEENRRQFVHHVHRSLFAPISTGASPGITIHELAQETTPVSAAADAEHHLSNPPVFNRFFFHKKLKFMWRFECESFVPLSGIDEDAFGLQPASTFKSSLNECPSLENSNACTVANTGTAIHRLAAHGVDERTRAERRAYFGPNALAVPITPLLILLYREILTPFYVFQIFAVGLWLWDDYHWFALAIVIMSLCSLSAATYSTRVMELKLRRMTDNSLPPVGVLRDNWTPLPGPGPGSGPDSGLTPGHDATFELLPVAELVPGDVIEVPRGGFFVPCDAVLLSGQCLVNEASLTGESAPVLKCALPDTEAAFAARSHSLHMLFAGTQVLQARYFQEKRVRALVLRTGFLTSKGELLRAIMYPKPLDFKFTRQSFQFLLSLGCIAVVGSIYAIVLFAVRGSTLSLLVRRSLDVFTVVVPPALPAAMTAGIVFAQRRLQNRGIYCVSPNSLNLAGTINLVAFDKTGTLTEEGLQVHGIMPLDSESTVSDARFASLMTSQRLPELLVARPPARAADASAASAAIDTAANADTGAGSGADADADAGADSLSGRFFSCKSLERALFECLACCHSLTTLDGRLVGDPLDVSMFETLRICEMEEPGEDVSRFEQLAPTVIKVTPRRYFTTTATLQPLQTLADVPDTYEMGLVRQLAFSSARQRMSVVVSFLPAKGLESGESAQFELFTKGAPEMIASLCRSETVPRHFTQELERFTRRGLRVLALAWRPLGSSFNYVKLQRAQPEALECDLRFLGLLLLENRLKPETPPVLRELHEARIRTLMVTGDNILTALSVARECRMVDSRDRVVLVSATLTPDVSGQQPQPPAYSTDEPEGQLMHQPQHEHWRERTFSERLDELTHLRPLFANTARRTAIDLSFRSEESIQLDLYVDSTWRRSRSSRWSHSRTSSASGPHAALVADVEADVGTAAIAVPPSVERSVQLGLKSVSFSCNEHEPNAGARSPAGSARSCEQSQASVSSNTPLLPAGEPLHLALTGDTWSVLYQHDRELLKQMLHWSTVLARMLPEQKQQLIECLQEIGYHVAMCGDGCNDCGALRAAQTGISLSEAEASVAAPFTSHTASIDCVPIVIREGRAALSTSFGIFRYQAAYALTQFSSVLLLYWFHSNLTDAQFLYVDLALATTLSATFGYTRACERLSRLQPRTNLVNAVPIGAMLVHLALIGAFQIFACWWAGVQTWYTDKPPAPDGMDGEKGYLVCNENSAVFIVSAFQYINSAVVFSRGPPFRAFLFTNPWFMLNSAIALVLTLFILLGMPSFGGHWLNMMELYPMPLHFRLLLLGLVSMNFFLSYLLEMYVFDTHWLERAAYHVQQYVASQMRSLLCANSAVEQRAAAAAAAKAVASARSRENSVSSGTTGTSSDHPRARVDSRAIVCLQRRSL